MTAIRVALENASETRDRITIHTYTLASVNLLNNRKLVLNTITRAIRNAASRLTQRPTINWLPTHNRISGNENTNQAGKRVLQRDRIPTTINTITFREQTKMKEQMTRHYNEQAYHDASQQTKDHRQLHQTDSSRRKLMSMPRKVQRSIWRLNMICPIHSQVTTGKPLRCRWCYEDYNSITEHWLRHCTGMIYWQELMTARLTEHETFFDDRETTIAILNSQNTLSTKRSQDFYKTFLFQDQIRKHN